MVSLKGPAASLFQKEYYELIKLALKPDGILCSQGWSYILCFLCRAKGTTYTSYVLGECAWLDGELINDMLTFCGSLFPVVRYSYANVPTYPSGQIGFLLCSRCPVSVSDNVFKNELCSYLRYFKLKDNTETVQVKNFGKAILGGKDID